MVDSFTNKILPFAISILVKGKFIKTNVQGLWVFRRKLIANLLYADLFWASKCNAAGDK